MRFHASITGTIAFLAQWTLWLVLVSLISALFVKGFGPRPPVSPPTRASASSWIGDRPGPEEQSLPPGKRRPGTYVSDLLTPNFGDDQE